MTKNNIVGNLSRDATLGVQPILDAHTDQVGEFLMIKSFNVKNFRCFEHVELTELKRINVVTGANATGKSALLEAIYLGGNATAAALQNINTGRAVIQITPLMIGGLISLPISILPQNFGINFNHLFRSWGNKNVVETAKRIEIGYEDTNGVVYTLGIAHQGTEDATPVPVVSSPGRISVSAPIIFDRTKTINNEKAENLKIPITVDQFGRLTQPIVAPFGPTVYLFGPGMNYAEADNVGWFSELKERNQAETVIGFVRDEFPFVKNIEILAPDGVNGLYSIMSDGTSRRFTVVSSGIYKIISILLACASMRDGIIVIDEIENGIFYEKYDAVWRVLYKFSKETRNQIFTSSHSAECLKGLVPIVESNENDFGLLRTERDDGGCVINQISGAAMKAALKRGGEIRGTIIGPTEENR